MEKATVCSDLEEGGSDSVVEGWALAAAGSDSVVEDWASAAAGWGSAAAGLAVAAAGLAEAGLEEAALPVGSDACAASRIRST